MGCVLASLKRGSLGLDPEELLTGILEVNTISEMQNAESQITIQVSIILTLT